MIQARLHCEAASALLAALPAAIGTPCRLRVIDADGDEVTCAVAGVLTDSDRPVEHRVQLAGGIGTLVIELPAQRLDGARDAIRAVARCIEERARLEGEMESVFSGSLQLLEEVAMTAEMLTQLPECTTDYEVVHLGLRSLLVGASLERVAWIEFDRASGMCTHSIELCVSHNGESVLETGDLDLTPFAPDGTVIARALRAGAEGVIESFGVDTSPPIPGLRRAREVLAVPARFADGGRIATQGVLVAMDKRANSYSSASRLGSQESKMTGTVALMIASAIGNRRAAVAGQELAVARAIQQQVLPDRAAVVPGFALVGRCETSGAVGGDYFDFVPMAAGRTLALVADVSGHNLASGMVMVGARAALRVIAGTTASPAGVFDLLAHALHDDLARTERFITAAGFAIAPGDSRVEFVGAGHPDALVLRTTSGAVERIGSTGAMFGFLPEQSYGGCLIELAPGDVLLLYTDGVIETDAPTGEPFGDERLMDLLARCNGMAAQGVLDMVFAELAAFRGARDAQRDDVTVLVLRRDPESEGAR